MVRWRRVPSRMEWLDDGRLLLLLGGLLDVMMIINNYFLVNQDLLLLHSSVDSVQASISLFHASNGSKEWCIGKPD